MTVSIRIPKNKIVSYKALGEWKQTVGMELKNELDPKYHRNVIEIAVFDTEEDLIMFRLAFGI